MKSPLRPHDFVEFRVQRGELYATVGLGRMLEGSELTEFAASLQRGLELGLSLVSSAKPDLGPDPDMPPPTAPVSDSLSGFVRDELALMFWRTLLHGIPFSGESEERRPVEPLRQDSLLFAVGEDGWLEVELVTGPRAWVSCYKTGQQSGPAHLVEMTRDIDEIRAYVLWLLRSSGIAVATPLGWPYVHESGAAPNDAGKLAAFEEATGPEADPSMDVAVDTAQAKDDRHALAFWRVALQGLPFSAEVSKISADPHGRGLYFIVGSEGLLYVQPRQACALVRGYALSGFQGTYHRVYIDNSIDDIRAYILWVLRTSGITVDTPAGWPDLASMITAPNNVGEPIE